VNPGHLLIGTQADNIRDKIERGRGDSGEKHGRAKLSANEVMEIRAKFSGERGAHVILAKEYGVSRPAITLILNGKRWSKGN
jgi:hypothetical protein